MFKPSTPSPQFKTFAFSRQEGFSIDDHSKAVSSYRGDFIQMSASRNVGLEMVDLFRLGDPRLWVTDLTTSRLDPRADEGNRRPL